MKKINLSMREWRDIFSIDPLDIIDELHLGFNAINNIDMGKDITLSIVQIARLSKIRSDVLENLIRDYYVSYC